MDKPYRWGDATPLNVQRIKDLRATRSLRAGLRAFRAADDVARATEAMAGSIRRMLEPYARTPKDARHAGQPCHGCGAEQAVLVSAFSEPFTRWHCECGATGRWFPVLQSGEALQPASSRTSEFPQGTDGHCGGSPQ